MLSWHGSWRCRSTTNNSNNSTCNTPTTAGCLPKRTCFLFIAGLLSRALNKTRTHAPLSLAINNNQHRCVEVGCGSGYVICSVALALQQLCNDNQQANGDVQQHHQNCCRFIATDISSSALAATAATLHAHKVCVVIVIVVGGAGVFGVNTRLPTDSLTHTIPPPPLSSLPPPLVVLLRSPRT